MTRPGHVGASNGNRSAATPPVNHVLSESQVGALVFSKYLRSFIARGPGSLTHRVPHLDGVRGVAVLLVFGDHLLAGVFPTGTPLFPNKPIYLGGGFTGVQLFFVLSGYLITGLLLSELRRSGTIGLLSFYKRRLRRLYPVLVLATTVYVFAGLILGHAPRAILTEAARALTYTSNLEPLWRALPKTLWLNHAWSLGVEEQFYLAWPLVVLYAWRGKQRRGVAIAAIMGALAAAVWRIKPPFEHAEYELLRWDALLLGALWAVLSPSIPKAVAVLAGVALVVQSGWPVDTGTWWSYLLADVGCLGMLCAAPAFRIFENRALVHMGRVSYSLYVWHLLFMRLGFPGWVNLLGSLILAEVSFRLVEAPFLSMGKHGIPKAENG